MQFLLSLILLHSYVVEMLMINESYILV